MQATLSPAGERSTAAPSTRYPVVQNYIGGRFVPGDGRLVDIFNPGDGSVISQVPLCSADAVDAAVRAAQQAFPGWSGTTIKERVQVFFRYRSLLEQHLDELTDLIVEEHGKVRGEAQAEVLKAIELTEFACSMPQITSGEVLEVSRGVDCRSSR